MSPVRKDTLSFHLPLSRLIATIVESAIEYRVEHFELSYMSADDHRGGQ